MALIKKDGASIELHSVISYYCEEDDIHNETDIGTYETFQFISKLNDEEVLTDVIGTSFELCSGNILSLIQMIEEGIETGKHQEIEFLEPNFSFEIKQQKHKNPEKEPSYVFQIWINSGSWEGVYGGADVGFRFSLKKTELMTFLHELKREWDNRKKEWYQ